jgi:IS5 family transposase
MRSQKDLDARWTKKHGKSHYGYKNNVNVDRTHKLVRRYHVSDAAQHDSQAVDHLLMRGQHGLGRVGRCSLSVRGDGGKAAGPEAEKSHPPKGQAPLSGILQMPCRLTGKPLTKQAKGSNRTKSTVRVRVEHIFGAQTNDMGGTLVRTINLVRAKAKIGMKNLAYNMRRLGQLRRINPCPA